MSDDAAENAAKINVRVRVKPLRSFPKYIAVTACSIRRQEGNPERGIVQLRKRRDWPSPRPTGQSFTHNWMR